VRFFVGINREMFCGTIKPKSDTTRHSVFSASHPGAPFRGRDTHLKGQHKGKRRGPFESTALLARTVPPKVASVSSDWCLFVAVLCSPFMATNNWCQRKPQATSSQRWQPLRSRRTAVVGSRLGDYNQATREPAAQTDRTRPSGERKAAGQADSVNIEMVTDTLTQ